MSLKRTLVKNTGYNVAGYLYLLLASFFSIPIVLHSLGETKYGVFALLTGFVPVMMSVDFGLSVASIRFLSLPGLSQKKKRKIWQSAFLLFLGSGLLVLAVSLGLFYLFFQSWPAFATIEQSVLLQAGLLVGLIYFLDNLNVHLLSLPQANQRFDIYNTRTLIVGTGNTLGTALLAQVSPNIIHLLWLRVGLYGLTGVSLFRYNWRYFSQKILLPRFERWSVRKLLGFGVRNFMGKVATQFKTHFSNYAIGSSLSAGSVALFYVPQNIIIKAAGGISQLTLAFFPMSTALSGKEKIGKLKRLVVLLEVLILLVGILQLVTVRFIGEPFLVWWLKDAQFAAQAYPVLKILSWFFFLTTLTPLPTAVLNSLNYPQVPSLFAVLTSLISVGLIIVLTPRMGIVGPAWAAVISSVLTVPIYLVVAAWMLIRYEPEA